MKMMIAVVAWVLVAGAWCGAAEPPFDSVNWNTWSWTAPDPPLPDTTWYDYGEGSTSNGPVPAGMVMAQATKAKAQAPTRAGTEAQLPVTTAAESWVNRVSVSPYATVAFADFDGDQVGGAGLEVGVGISRAVSLVGFGESDDTEHEFIDRAGLGLRVTGRVTKALSVFGQMSGGFAFDESPSVGQDESPSVGQDEWFLRPEFGATVDFWRKGNAHVGAEASWGMDVGLDGRTAQRLRGGLVAGTSF